MRKIFLFLFAAVLSIGTAMAQTEVYLTDATVSLDGQNLVVQAQWGERQITISLWQQNTQGTGTYAAADIYCSVLNPWGEWTATTDENSYQEMGGSFSFSGYFTDGTEIYDVWIQGSAASSDPATGEMEAKDGVNFSYYGEGVWAVEAYADDSSWGMQLELAFDEMTGEYNASGYYITDLMTYDMVEVAGTGLLYYDDFTGRMVFKANSLTTSDSQEIYPILYASSMDLGLSNTTFPVEASPWEDYGHTGYSYILLASDDWNWILELNIKNFNGAGNYSLDNPTYEEEVWDDYLEDFETVTKTLYSKYNENIPIMGNITVTEDEGLLSYECSLYTVDAEGNMGTMLNAIVMESNAETFDIEADNATVAEGNYPLEFTCTWNDGDMDHSVKVEVTEVKYGQEVPANFFFDGGISADGDQAEATVTVTKSGNTVTVIGSFESWNTGNIYNVNLSGTLPAGILETVVFADGEDYTDLLAQYAGQKVNAQVERMLLNDGLNTLTLPFDIAASQIGNIKAYQITSVVENRADEIEIVCTEKTTLLAGQPYIIEVLGRSIWAIEANGVVIKNVSPSNVVAKGETTTVTMHGVLNTTGETTNGLYWIGELGYLYNDDVDKLGLRAYFSITTSTGIAPRMRVVTKEDAETGLDNITTGTKAVKAIENGQLIIIRDGVKYNVQGQKL
mgnify:CR=1 FL=1